MYLLPAIDILDGRVVRLAQGDYHRVTVYNDDPLDQATKFQEAGASWIHVVDLNGALTGRPEHLDMVSRIKEETGLNIEVGGGIRNMETLELYDKMGVNRMVLGTAIIKDQEFAQMAAEKYGTKIVAAVDARDGEVVVEGWCESAGVPAIKLACQLSKLGISNLFYTDIARDGMQVGVDATAYKNLAILSDTEVVASGGISTLKDLRLLNETGSVWGVVVGRALYEGAFTVREAIEYLDKLDSRSFYAH